MAEDRQTMGSFAIGQIYIDTPQVLNLAVAGTYYQIVGATADLQIGTTIASSRITVKESGYYRINFSSSFTHANNNSVIHQSLFIDGVENTKFETERKIGNGGDVGAVAFGGVIYLTANQIVDIRAKILSGTGNLTTNHFNFNISLIN